MNDYLIKLHADILKIMDQIHTICVENSIKYYIIGGTLLGAVRHGGFIPWDDDFDICMPRDDFNNFVSICEKMLPSNLKLLWITTDSNYWHPFAKIVNSDTTFSEGKFGKIGREYGIFVDIFPLDDGTYYCDEIFQQKKKIHRYHSIIYSNVLSPVGNFKQKIRSIIFNSKKTFNKMILECCKNNHKNLPCYCNFGSQYSIKKQTIDKTFFGCGKNYSFEGRDYIGPVEGEKVLESIYGKDYMTIPPVEERKIHYPNYVIFSDGEKIEFDHKKDEIITINDVKELER